MFPSVDFLEMCVVHALPNLLFVVLHGTLGSYLLDALQGGGVAAVACLPALRPPCLEAYVYLFLLFLDFYWWIPLLSL
jgi:hypothetical protein